MSSANRTARIAGLLYLVNAVTGFFGIIYVPNRLIVSGNAAATANKILDPERLFRLGIASELICAVEFVFVIWTLYRLLGGVNKTLASLMVILGLAFVPIMCMSALNGIAALSLVRGADFLSVFDPSRRQALAMLFLDLRRYGYLIGWIFGIWFFPLGVLVFKSGFLHRVRELREARGWTQVDFGNLLKVSRQTIYAIETGLYDPSLPLALAIGRVFGCPVEAIFEDDSSNTKKGTPTKPPILRSNTKTR